MPEGANVENPTDTSSTAPDDEVSLLDLLIVLAKHKRIVLGFSLAAGIVAAIVSLLLPNIYTGTSRILPPQQSASAPGTTVRRLPASCSTSASTA